MSEAAIVRCPWPGDDPLYQAYHDEEWGVPELDDRALFEKLILDGFQAGLSWITILKKRENFRRAFDGFEPARIARYTDKKIERLLQDAGIVRHRGKIEGAIASAKAYQRIAKQEGGFSEFLWSFVGGAPIVNHWRRMEDAPTKTAESAAMSKALKAEGFTFCGPTICYAFMQAVGMVNDHTVECFRHAEVQEIWTQLNAS
ncbi:MAG: DNA-3-methyladenine glycosylase I [Pseudomonadota bacterium]